MNPEPLELLLVDDVPENLIVLEALLRRDGLRILQARSGAQALELLLTHDVALALLDVQMPEMDGFELAELMRGTERTKHVPIIFVTAGTRDPQRVFRGYDSGAVDFLFKPLEPHVLKSKVDVFLELASQRRQLAAALQLNEVFVGILGHDLRNPLNSFQVGVDFLAGEVTDERHQRVLRRMRSSGQRMQAMINELLDLTRMRLGGGIGVVRHPVEVELHGLLERTIDELRAIHDDRPLVLEGATRCAITGDRERLNQLFSNLIGNAIVHGTPGTRITTRLVARERDIVVEVHNHGAIPRERLPHLFEPFRGRERTSAGGGLGLGLYIADQIARAHGGSIEVASSEETGTVFTVTLPRAGAAAA
ncbi:MAG TPA: hybrid sensor histidine kinase/response regulator [Kofleriaceae bacterium]|nr:hybrid sensor histidine kinase/response regulator [Kofleriaceae bacterium]